MFTILVCIFFNMGLNSVKCFNSIIKNQSERHEKLNHMFLKLLCYTCFAIGSGVSHTLSWDVFWKKNTIVL